MKTKKIKKTKTSNKLNSLTGEEFKTLKKATVDAVREQCKAPGKLTKAELKLELKRIKSAADLLNTGGIPEPGQTGMAIMSESMAKKFLADKHFRGDWRACGVLLDDAKDEPSDSSWNRNY